MLFCSGIEDRDQQLVLSATSDLNSVNEKNFQQGCESLVSFKNFEHIT